MRAFLALIVAAAVLGALSVATSERGLAADARVQACELGPSKVAAVFDIARARDIWTHLPAMGISPELETDEPVSIVVYDGEVDTLLLGRAGLTRGALSDVVCVVHADGSRTVYENVSRAGFRAP